MKPFIKDNHADVKMIGGVVGILVTLIVAILLFYNIAGSIDTSTIDSNIQDMNMSGQHYKGHSTGEDTNRTPAANATNDILDQGATFFQIAPIIAIVVVAVVILGYVGKIGGVGG